MTEQSEKIKEKNKCEMCRRILKDDSSTCLKCHCEVCDMPLCECIGKQELYKKSNCWDREILFDDIEVEDYKKELKAELKGAKK